MVWRTRRAASSARWYTASARASWPSWSSTHRGGRSSEPVKPPSSDSLVAIAASNAVIAAGVVAGPLVEVGDHAEAHRVHDRPVEAREAVGRRPVVALAPRRGRRRGRQLRLRVDAGRERERIVGRLAVEVEHAPPAAAGLVEIAAGGRLLGVERMGQRHRRDVVMASKISSAASRSSSQRSRHAGQEVEEAAARQRQGPGALVGLARAGEGVVEPALALDRPCPVSQCGQLAPPAISQRGLGVVVGDRPVERGSEVVVLLVDRA